MKNLKMKGRRTLKRTFGIGRSAKLKKIRTTREKKANNIRFIAGRLSESDAQTFFDMLRIQKSFKDHESKARYQKKMDDMILNRAVLLFDIQPTSTLAELVKVCDAVEQRKNAVKSVGRDPKDDATYHELVKHAVEIAGGEWEYNRFKEAAPITRLAMLRKIQPLIDKEKQKHGSW